MALYHFFIIIIASIIHVIGETLYKSGSEEFFLQNNSSVSIKSVNGLITNIFNFIFKKIIFLSIMFSILAKLLFAISLMVINLSVASPIYLSLISIFSLVIGYIKFSEQINFMKIIGLFAIVIGTILVSVY
ncbi:MAG: hypothetical protein OEZ01_06630 [Candidatus Heimdallarchaeota archaeon]|nr:hypothetical protein [Candidatus Heimdallarchaeota archaeon]MDH5645664.1 hypothetical protein [Candidatus Heimdallarchaeota archaeon]